MVFIRTTQRAARVLITPNLEELAHPAHANRMFCGPALKLRWQISHCPTERRPINRSLRFQRDRGAPKPPFSEFRQGNMGLEKGWIKLRVLDTPNKQGSGFKEESRIGGGTSVQQRTRTIGS